MMKLLNDELKSKVAIITGHRSGVGKAIFELMETLGVRVFGLDLPECDLRQLDKIKNHVERVMGSSKRIDILVNNAGITNLGSVVETPLAEVEEVLTVNLKAPFFLMQAVIPHMQRAKSGSIVNIASDQALVGKRFSAIYGASKAALAQLTKSAALDYAGDGIRINCVAPGSTDTPMLRMVISKLQQRYPEVYPSNSEQFYKNSIPLKRFADPKEIAHCVAFMASNLASFMTGIVLPIDGGFTAQ